MEVTLKLEGLEGVLKTLKELPPAVVSRRGGPVLASLRKGAKILQKQEIINLLATIAQNADDGESESTGLLAKNIIVSRGKAPTNGSGERVLVRIKRKSYQRKGKAVTTLKTAHLKEFGSATQEATPFIRPAFQSKAETAIRTVEKELVAGIDRIVKKLARQNRR